MARDRLHLRRLGGCASNPRERVRRRYWRGSHGRRRGRLEDDDRGCSRYVRALADRTFKP